MGLSDAAATLRPSTPSRSSSEDSGLVWPGILTSFQQQHPQSAPLLGSTGKHFSFDWSRGRSPYSGSGKGAEKGGTVPFLSAFGDGPFTSRQRWKHFIALLLASGLMFMLAGAFLPLVLLRPQKFCLFFTLGSMLSMASFAVLRGPLEQLKHMFSLQRYDAAQPPWIASLPSPSVWQSTLGTPSLCSPTHPTQYHHPHRYRVYRSALTSSLSCCFLSTAFRSLARTWARCC